MGQMKHWGAFSIILIYCLFLAGCKREVLPAIRDGAVLRRDCLALCQQLSNGYVPRQKWPTSISELHPARVVYDSNVIEITVCQDTTKVSGYVVLVNDDTWPAIQYSSIEPTGIEGVYQFELPFVSKF
jgi:hypothetical protein